MDGTEDEAVWEEEGAGADEADDVRERVRHGQRAGRLAETR